MEPRNRHERRKFAALERKQSSSTKIVHGKPLARPVISEHPLGHIPKDVLRAKMLEEAKKAAIALPAIRDELITLLKGCDPAYFLASISQAVMYIGIDSHGNIVKAESRWSKKLLQYHIELAQALYLSIPISDLSFAPCHPAHIQAISDKLFDLGEAFKDSRYVGIENLHDKGEKELLYLQERIRIHTLAVRNWGYYSQCIRILKELVGPLDADCKQLLGLAGTTIIDVLDIVLRSIEKHSNEHREKLAIACTKPTKREMITEYVHQFGIPEDQIEALLSIIRERKWGKRQLFSFLLSHSALFAVEGHYFEVETLAQLVNVTANDLAKSLDRLSLSYGSLTTFNLEHLFLANPVWERPFIKTADGNYLCFLPQLFFAFSFSFFGSIFDTKETQSRYSDQRARFLEEGVSRCFSNAFGDQKAESNVKWSYSGTNYETDLLVQVDSQLFIVEAKSHRISWPALRGAPDRLKRHVNEIFVEPAIQSKRLEDAIKEWQGGDKSKLSLQSTIDLENVREVTRLSITLEDLASIQSNLKDLSETGLVKPDFTMAVTMSLADLQSLFEILVNPVERIFYLKRRRELQEIGLYVADELDLLGLYLTTGLQLEELEDGGTHLTAIGMSEKVDEYLQARDQGYDPPRPQRPMTAWFAAIRDRLEEKRPPRWTEAALVLLGIPYEAQQELEANLNRVKRQVRAGKGDVPLKDNAIALVPPKWRDIGLVCVVLRESERENRHEIMRNSTAGVFSNSNAQRCLVLVCDAESAAMPYVSLAVFDRSKPEVASS